MFDEVLLFPWLVGCGFGDGFFFLFFFGVSVNGASGHLEDTPWALYRTAKGSEVKTPMDNRCEMCFKVWQAAYSFMDFDRLCVESVNATSDVAASLEAVRKKMEAKESPEKGAALSECRRVELELTRSFVVATEAEIRSHLKIPRLAKSHVKGLASLQLPNDGGSQDEQHFIFKDPDSPFRKMACKVVLATNSEYEVLGKNQVYWEQQADRHFQQMLTDRSSNLNLSKLVQGGMQDFQSWASAKFNVKGEADEGEKPAPPAAQVETSTLDGGVIEDDEDGKASEDEMQFEGVGAVKPAGLAWSCSSTTLGLEKRASGSSVATPKVKKAKSQHVGESVDSKSVAGTVLGDSDSRVDETSKTSAASKPVAEGGHPVVMSLQHDGKVCLKGRALTSYSWLSCC